MNDKTQKSHKVLVKVKSSKINSEVDALNNLERKWRQDYADYEKFNLPIPYDAIANVQSKYLMDANMHVIIINGTKFKNKAFRLQSAHKMVSGEWMAILKRRKDLQ